jgi:HAD superfamily hydrolase (TIGR01509 family)
MPITRPDPRLEAVVFDVYGTLVEIGDKRAPFRQLLKHGERQGRPSTPSDATAIMATPLALRDAASLFGIALTANEAAQLERDLDAEIASCRLFPESLLTLHALRNRGLKLALCSNLAADYGPPIMALLRDYVDVHVFSFESGHIKPDPAIYAHACKMLNCEAGAVLMVGDTPLADVDGPRAVGMQSILLDRSRRAPSHDAIVSLSDLLLIGS